MIPMKGAWVAATAFCILGVAVPARAGSIVFSNFGPGHSFNSSQIYAVNGAQSSASMEDSDWAMGFMPTGTYTLDAIVLAVVYNSGGFGNLDFYVSLTADASGSPGAVLESWTFHLNPGLFTCLPSGSLPPCSANSVLQPMLVAGTPYWLVADVPDRGGPIRIDRLVPQFYR